MTKLDDGGSAFPRTGSFTPDGDKRFDSTSLDGMSLRDWFAGQALSGVVRQCAGDVALGYPEGVSSLEELFARNSYRIADAMIAARKKGPSDE